MLEMLKERKVALEAQGKKGFTLMEMLIVIAIIAILIAIAIPLFTNQLNAARDAADEANARSLYAAVVADDMLGGRGTITGNGTNSITYKGVTYTFNHTATVNTNGTVTVELTSGEVTVPTGNSGTAPTP